MASPSAIALLKYFQVVQSVGLFVLPPFIVAYLYEGNAIKYLTLDKKISLQIILIGLLAVIVSQPLAGYLGGINEKLQLPEFLSGFENWMKGMEENAADLIDRFMQVETIWGLLFNLFMIAVIPAVGEELLFRGVIQKIFTNMTRNYHWGIWISAFLFSALHMQFFGFLPRMALGALFGYLLVYSGTIWLPIVAHFLNNTFGVLALYAEKEGSKTAALVNDYSFETTTIMAIMAAISLAVTIWLLGLIKRKSGEIRLS
jgi:membrane protease YdiL (CAAX protease family)